MTVYALEFQWIYMFSLNDYTFYPTYKKIMSIEFQTNFFRKTGLAFASSYVNGLLLPAQKSTASPKTNQANFFEDIINTNHHFIKVLNIT